MRKRKIILSIWILSISLVTFGQNFVLLNLKGNLIERIGAVIIIGICIYIFGLLYSVITSFLKKRGLLKEDDEEKKEEEEDKGNE
jgi:predicted histidine transporter YuiF (NhaC family)